MTRRRTRSESNKLEAKEKPNIVTQTAKKDVFDILRL
jgi:hypothetical protein